jgi:hypothetical protein
MDISSAAGSGEIVVQVDDIRHLFAAPDVDPLSDSEAEATGEAALLRVVRQLMATRQMASAHKLLVLMPGERIEPGLQARARAALERYCRLKLEDIDQQQRVMRREAGRLLLRGILILMVCMGLSSLFNSETFTALPPLLSSTLGEGFNVIGWVMLWRPVEAYFFNPLPLKTSAAAHRFVRTLQIEIRPKL